MTTIAEALREAARRLAAVSDTARLDAEVLMAHVLGVSRSELLLRFTGETAPEGFAALADRRMAHEPVAYIVGTQEFYGLEFAVTRDVLIPRADSETTLEAALAARPGALRVLDCGTGSGALLLAFLHHAPAAQGVGIDASAVALALAEANSGSLGLAGRAQFLQRDWTIDGWAEDLGRFDLVLANPPYVEDGAALDRSVREFEPAGALFAGAEGLDDYRVLVPQLPDLLAHGGAAVLEIGASQAGPVSAIAAEAGFATALHHDLACRPRALVLSI